MKKHYCKTTRFQGMRLQSIIARRGRLLLKTLTAVVLTAAVFTSGGAFSMATAMASTGGGEIALPNYTYITSTSCTLSISNGIATCKGSTRVQNGYTAEVIVELQVNDGGWRNVARWSDKYSILAGVVESYSVTSGKTYRLKVTHKACNSSGTVLETVYSYD